MRMVKKCLLLSLLLLSMIGVQAVEAAKLQKIPAGWMGAQETFPIWYAKQQGWDKKLGLDIELVYFNSGMDAMNTLPAKTWVIAGMGALPAMIGALRQDIYVIADCNEEASANAVMVRKDSPILKNKGFNNAYPEVYGSPESVKGKTVLTTAVSSAHYALVAWLKTLGLSEKDIVLKNMDQASALAAFDYGIGDIVALWAPLTFVGNNRGWRDAATLKNCGVSLPIVMVADKSFADDNPEVVAKFLYLYIRAAEAVKKMPNDKLIPIYLRFYSEWTGAEYDTRLAELDIASHPLFTIEELLRVYDDSAGPSMAQRRQANIAKFFHQAGKITDSELAKVEKSAYVTNKFLTLATKIQLPE